ncbi:hypothetical protein SDRG_16912 [Saprolegnia diclina VS20]|uniref:START domain-containing protein n=1 Tax=Saprolegnia diclina (strain VS20) TaxID=1156394 RepID=T0PIL1_SAPDV|nr:hypothetical protein SDRG_16912 [Saprolegnia diclina VS20]EQC25214.1 hypothetical protein SDRG_16912 [Saprolegnia diclina VS20]|eukprot:XP_008621358.1 hypothetical protein SDRG_16912 [Saprolegnia diclina VS20]
MGNGASTRPQAGGQPPTEGSPNPRRSFNFQRMQELYQRLFSTPANPNVIPVLGSDWYTQVVLAASPSQRSSSCDLVLTNLRNKTDAALSCVQTYLDAAQSEYPKIFYGDAAIDFVLSCSMLQPLDVASSVEWPTFKTILPGVLLSRHSVLDVQLGYAQVVVADGMEPGTPLLLHVLYRRYIRDNRVILVLQSITNDELYTIDQRRLLCLSGWLVFDRVSDTVTQARAILRCEAKLDAVPAAIQVKDERLTVHTQWILQILSGIYAPVATKLLNAPSKPNLATT